MLDYGEISTIFTRLQGKLARQNTEADCVDSWLRPSLEVGFDLPHNAKPEHKSLSRLSRTPWLKLVVDNVVQTMFVDNIYSGDGPATDLWRIWRANKMHSRQIANHRAFVAYGHSYALVTQNILDPATPLVRLLSPRSMAVEFDDVGGFSHYPSAALYRFSRNQKIRYALFVPGEMYEIEASTNSDKIRVADYTPLDVDYVPVAPFANQVDLDGTVVGEVLPFVPTAKRIHKTVYDRLLAQHYNSWKVKTVTGLDLPDKKDEHGDPTDELDEKKTKELKMQLSQDDLLIAESPEVRFGVLDATALDPFVTSFRSDIESLAAVSQTPAHALTGQMSNLTPEALAAARGPLMQKVSERKINASASYETVLQMLAEYAGLENEATDPLIRVTWQDTEIRSMSQAVDALGKAAQMLGVPKRALWAMIPNVERSTIEEWERQADEELETDPMTALFQRQSERATREVSDG